MLFKFIFYKVWCKHRHNICQSFCLVVIPLLPFIFFMILSESAEGDSNNERKIYNKTLKASVFEDSYPIAAYYPNNDLTTRLMNNVKELLPEGEFFGFNKESDIERWFLNQSYVMGSLGAFNGFGVIFHLEQPSQVPRHLKYTIRGNRRRLPEAEHLFPKQQINGPMDAGNGYIYSKFLSLKVAIDDSFLSTIGLKEANWTLQKFPYPANNAGRGESFRKLFEKIFTILIASFFLYNFMNLASFVVNEKITGITERLRMVGMNDIMMLLGYLIHSFVTYVLAVTLIGISCKVIPSIFFEKSNYLIISLVLILFCLQSSAFFLAASAVFTKPTLAGYIVSIIFIVPGYLVIFRPSMSVASQALSSLLPVIYLFWAVENMFAFEKSGIGATFSTLVKVPTSGYCGVPLLGLMCLSLFGTVLYCLLYIYIVNVKPGPYGFAKPWHYIFRARCFDGVKKSSIYSINSDHGPVKSLYEKVPDNVEVGLQISNLHKRFGNVISVKDVSLNIYVGEVTALLGHNGAGKTTTLSMIAGMYKPTSGTIYYQGYNVFTNLPLFQQDLGMCPQENMLIEEISVWEHLKIFGMLKNIPPKELNTSTTHALNQVNLIHKKAAIVRRLSGGMKRKLCLAIALIGNPKVIILDEPTSGLDPESRREIWDIILLMRENRVIILTTHYMEEADALGEHIAIMDHGEIKCYGTPMFLKKRFGAGYQITLSINNSSNFNNIISFVTERIPSATVMNTTEDYIVFSVPSSKSGDFPGLFSELEVNHEFSITRIGIKCTTMDEVFLKVRLETDEQNPNLTVTHNDDSFLDVLSSDRSLNPCTGFFQRLIALLLKNILYMRSIWMSVLLLVAILPIFLSYWAMNETSYFKSSINSPSITFDLNEYGVTEVLLEGSITPEIRQSFTDLIKKGGHHYVDVESLGRDNIIDGLLKVAKEDEPKFRQSYIVAGSFNEATPNALYSSIALHAPVIALNLMYNAILKSEKEGYTITSISQPFVFTEGICDDFDYSSIQTSVQIAWFFLTLAFSSLIGNIFVKSPHNERTSLLKHLQLMTGVSPFTYWLSVFLRDIFIFGVCMAFMFTIFVSLDEGLLAVDNAKGVLALIMILLGISGIWMGYCFTFLFKNSSGAEILFIAGSFLIGVIAHASFFFIKKGSKYMFLNYILRIIPFASFVKALELFLDKAMDMFRRKTCPNAHSIPYATEGFIDSDLAFELYFLVFDWLLYFTIVMLAEFGILSKLWDSITLFCYNFKEDSYQENFESDVAKEKGRVDAALQTSDKEELPTVIVDSLVKRYSPNFTAVHDVSFVSEEGECFGLLGLNGAGKTTTFNILTGVLYPTKGRIFIKGYDLCKRNRLCLSFMGYCPQFSALGEGMTGREMLTLFANLRLAEPRLIKRLVNRWIFLLGLEEYCDRVCGTYSGGNKRKLSTAMAFINNPSVILLDEPSSGVDPVTRRNLWAVLKNCQNNKQAIIISSHSMDECEAVCDRLTIMAEGRMQCIGNTEHLKSLYGKGYIILIKLKEHSDDDRNSLKMRMSSEFESKASLKDEHMMLLHYHVTDPNYQLSSMFRSMEDICKDFQIIEEYSISDASLEDIFLSFGGKEDES